MASLLCFKIDLDDGEDCMSVDDNTRCDNDDDDDDMMDPLGDEDIAGSDPHMEHGRLVHNE